MKKVIKHGKTEFRSSCPTCGCLFKYDTNDIYLSTVDCPDCGNPIAHADQRELQYESEIIPEPCKLGDTVFALFNGKIAPAKVFAINRIDEDNNYSFNLRCRVQDGISQSKVFRFGEDVFITIADAEKALAEREKK